MTDSLLPTLDQLTTAWDSEFRENSGLLSSGPVQHFPLEDTADLGRPYTKILTSLLRIYHVRFQPFQNDIVHHYPLKLIKWLNQFPKEDRKYAFLLASKLIFITQQQFESLQRLLYSSHIRRILLERIIREKQLSLLAFDEAQDSLDSEMDATLFVANSDSAGINSFVHVNREYFHHRGRRKLVGPEIRFWTYPQKRLTGDSKIRATVNAFEKDVLASDSYIKTKKRIVIIEDFSGTGSDLCNTLNALNNSNLPVSEVIIAAAMSTYQANDLLKRKCEEFSSIGKRSYQFVSAMTLPDRCRCFETPEAGRMSEPSYVDCEPIQNLSENLSRMSEFCFEGFFKDVTELPLSGKHGFGGLALAFVFYTNTPDNALPMLWQEAPKWTPLFRRASHYI